MPNQINASLTSWASELEENALEQALRTVGSFGRPGHFQIYPEPD